MANCFTHYYALISKENRPEGMDLHPQMLAYRLCASHARYLQIGTIKESYKSLVFRSYADMLRTAILYSSSMDALLEPVLDYRFACLLDKTADKVWETCHKEN